MEHKKILVKVGTSTLTHENGRINYRRVEQLVKVLSELQNMGYLVMLVSSGAVGVGVGKLRLRERPTKVEEKQAAAAVGQCELMFIYDKLFREYNHIVAQILLTRETVDKEHTRQNVINTINTLLDMGVIPIINENDSVAIDELEGENFGDNDMLSAVVGKLLSVDKLIILSDIDGLYDKNPNVHKDAKLIPFVENINEDIFAMASGTNSNRGTGGMQSKIHAAQVATSVGVEVKILNGEDPEILYDVIIKEKNIGTTFKPLKRSDFI